MFIKKGKVLERYRDLTYLIYTQMIQTQCIYYICNATAMRIGSSVGKRAVFTFSRFDTGSSPTRRLHLCFKFHIFVKKICFYMILLIKK